MYSQKVIDHFTNPRNMGEPKDWDAVGKVGNSVCLPPEELVQTNGSLEPISSIDAGVRVLSHDGNYHNVRRTFQRNYRGEVLEIKNRFGMCRITPEHECYAIKLPKRSNYYQRIKNKRKQKPFWYHAVELERGDLLCYPVLKETEDIDEIGIEVEKRKYDSRSSSLPKVIRVNDDFLRLVGYYLAEGYVRDEKCNTYVSFTFHADEKEYVNDVKNIVNGLFSIDAKIDVRAERKTTNVLVYNAHLARFFKRMFGCKAEDKALPHFMILLPPEKQKSIIKGLWRGDGFVNLRIPRAGFSTISHRLCSQLKTLLLRQGIIPSIYTEKERTGKDDVKHRIAYRIHVGQKDSLQKLFKLLGTEYRFTRGTAIGSWMDKDYTYIPITEIMPRHYNGVVHNLEVWDSMSYVSTSATLHNCGDIMYIYIKVDKKTDTITDIGFKTMGCAAAIATSSMITELAKGRKLDDALKITRGNVAEALDGLPPIKMHCSNLAADGLHKAIENYRSGKREGETKDEVLTQFTQKVGLDRKTAEDLWNNGIISVEELFRLSREELLRLSGITGENVEKIIKKRPSDSH